MRSIEAEFELLKSDVDLTENQFFVVLADENISEHEKDVGLAPDTGADIDTRRGRVMSKLRGTGTVTKSMMKNVAASFVNGDCRLICRQAVRILALMYLTFLIGVLKQEECFRHLQRFQYMIRHSE